MAVYLRYAACLTTNTQENMIRSEKANSQLDTNCTEMSCRITQLKSPRIISRIQVHVKCLGELPF